MRQLVIHILVEVIIELCTYYEKNKKSGMYTSRELEICQALSKVKCFRAKITDKLRRNF